MPRKHLIASKTNKKQQSQAKIWQKCAKEIKAATKVGGTNPNTNARLRSAIERALANNLSRDSIQKNINGANKDENNLTDVQFECYGPNGIQIIINGVTDNINRTLSSLHGYLAKLPGTIAKTNSVKIFFANLGVIIIYKKDTLEQLLEKIIDFSLVDLQEADDGFILKTTPNDFYAVLEILKNANYQIFSSEICLVAQNQIQNLPAECVERLQRFINACEEDDDIQNVVTNYEE